jgi:hypothetical protein
MYIYVSISCQIIRKIIIKYSSFVVIIFNITIIRRIIALDITEIPVIAFLFCSSHGKTKLVTGDRPDSATIVPNHPGHSAYMMYLNYTSAR